MHEKNSTIHIYLKIYSKLCSEIDRYNIYFAYDNECMYKDKASIIMLSIEHYPWIHIRVMVSSIIFNDVAREVTVLICHCDRKEVEFAVLTWPDVASPW